jgi:hypothetical protein
MVATELVLDRDVRNWVLIPLTATVLLMQLLRQYMTQVRGARRRPGSPASTHCVIAAACRRCFGHRSAVCYCLAMQLFTGSKPPVDASKGTTEVAQKGAVARSNMLRANGSFMTEAGFRQRKLFFAAKV